MRQSVQGPNIPKKRFIFQGFLQHGSMDDARLMYTVENTGPKNELTPVLPSPFERQKGMCEQHIWRCASGKYWRYRIYYKTLIKFIIKHIKH